MKANHQDSKDHLEDHSDDDERNDLAFIHFRSGNCHSDHRNIDQDHHDEYRKQQDNYHQQRWQEILKTVEQPVDPDLAALLQVKQAQKQSAHHCTHYYPDRAADQHRNKVNGQNHAELRLDHFPSFAIAIESTDNACVYLNVLHIDVSVART